MKRNVNGGSERSGRCAGQPARASAVCDDFRTSSRREETPGVMRRRRRVSSRGAFSEPPATDAARRRDQGQGGRPIGAKKPPAVTQGAKWTICGTDCVEVRTAMGARVLGRGQGSERKPPLSTPDQGANSASKKVCGLRSAAPGCCALGGDGSRDGTFGGRQIGSA
jgi:hypothetical protein